MLVTVRCGLSETLKMKNNKLALTQTLKNLLFDYSHHITTFDKPLID